MIVYYSTSSETTQRFVERLGLPSLRIPISAPINQPYVLVTPTYNGRVPGPVLRFLRLEENRRWIRGVVAAGNTNFGAEYGAAGRAVSRKCQVPLLHTFELAGTPSDIEKVRFEVENLWRIAA